MRGVRLSRCIRGDVMMNWIRRAAECVLIWCICREAEKRGVDLGIMRTSARHYVERAWGDALDSASFHRTEVEILEARLRRRYDPGMALNEAANRAMQDKAAARQAIPLSSKQLAALEVQKQYLDRIVKNS